MNNQTIPRKTCHVCGVVVTSDFGRCHDCLVKARLAQRAFHQRNRAKGLCRCGGVPQSTDGKSQCRKCWLNNIAKLRTGSTKNAGVLEQILTAQEQRCAYTGEVLIPGVNASLDHKTPVSRGGVKDAPENLQWVSERINRMKTDLTHDEFLAMCHLILTTSSGGRADRLVMSRVTLANDPRIPAL